MQTAECDKTKENSKASKMNAPKVSVVMSVFNEDLNHLDRAIDSILEQSFSDFEFLIINDGSDKICSDHLHSLQDERIIVIDNDNNMGLAASLNRGIENARGQYIARMDSDDYSYRDRLKRQVRYMDEHTETDVICCVARVVSEGKTTDYTGIYRKFDHDDFYIQLSYGPMQFPHPTVVFRKSFLEKYGLKYDTEFKRAQDYNMWARCAEKGKFGALQEVLFDYNDDKKQASNPSALQREFADRTKLYCLKRLLPNCSQREEELYVHMKDLELFGTPAENIALVKRLVEANDIKGVYNPKKYRSLLYFWWGRKVFYKCNREYLKDFRSNKGFKREITGAITCNLAGYILDKLTEKKYQRMANNS